MEGLAKSNIFIELIEEVQKGGEPFKVVVRCIEPGKDDRILMEGPSCSNPLKALDKGGEKAVNEMKMKMDEYFNKMDMSGWE